MRKTLVLVLLLLALAACSAPVTESVTELLPDDSEPAVTPEPAPVEEVVATAPAAAEASVVADEPAAEALPTCDPAVIPAATGGGVMLRFLNLSGAELSGVWHDTSQTPSQLVNYFQLADREFFDQETFAEDEWLLLDEEGRTLLDFVASTEATQCVVIYPHFEYEGEDGPEAWAELSDHYETCGRGQEQSPIDLANASLADLENISFNYGETAVNIINNGHTIQVNVSSGSHIVINGETYNLAQFHFHAPGEHTVAGQSYPLEMHLVHRAANKALAVVGVFIAEGAENEAFAPVWEHLPAEETGVTATGASVNVAALLPANQLFYRYNGSLTTPPCSEGVLWSVMSTPIEMSAEQIAAFTDIIAGNNRPVQPIAEGVLQLDESP
jgi:carbonic anhydrase